MFMKKYQLLNTEIANPDFIFSTIDVILVNNE